MPIAEHPRLAASYGAFNAPLDRAAERWQEIENQLAAARNYWIATAGTDLRPHVMPVWGLWLNGAFCFATDAASRKMRNLDANPQVSIHLESGDDVVVIEGIAEPLVDPALLDDFIRGYQVKYGITVDPANPGNVCLQVTPRIAHTWQESDFLATAIRWRFEPES